MIRISSEKELLESFRPLDRETIELPENLQFPLIIKDYFTWIEPSGCRIYLVYQDAHKPTPYGIVFRRDQSAGPNAQMCSWCQSVGTQGEVSLLTAQASRNRRVGLPLCRDLDCKNKGEPVEGAENSPFLMSHPVQRRLNIRRKMTEFARQNLF